MTNLLVHLVLTLASWSAVADPVERIKGIGKDRAHLTPEMVHTRTEAGIRALEFWILRTPAMQFAPERVFADEMWTLIQNSAQKENIDPLDLAALIALESQGRPYAQSPTGPIGICQSSLAQGIDSGLVKVELRQGTKKVWRGKGKNRKLVTVPSGKKVRHVVFDRRLDINYAIPACAAWLAEGLRTYGSIDFAVQRHHNGNNRVLRIISLYTGEKIDSNNAREVVARHNLSMAQIFFNNTPYSNPALYNYLETIRKENDSAPNYFLRHKSIRGLLELYLIEPQLYADRYEYYRTEFKEDGVAPSRMWYFYTPDQVQKLQFDDLIAIQAAREAGRLVPLPEPWLQFGFQPRMSGKSPIAEKDPKNRHMYIHAEAGTIGALLYIMDEAKLLQGKNFVSYEVNSLVRTAEYQNALTRTNANARTLLPTHTMGKAFDLPMKGISANRRRDLLFILSDLDANGMISYIPEGSQDTIHVVPHPQWEPFFERYYWQKILPVRIADNLADKSP